MISLNFENKYYGKIIAGADEVGKGPLAGPVVAASVIINPEIIFPGINDSKKLSVKKRIVFAEKIKLHYQYAIGEASVAEIDEINILNATKLAFIRSIDKLINKPEVVLIDGNMIFNDKRCISIINGDQICYSIAAASIIAKVYRDNLMTEFAQSYPVYKWEKNAGYGTEAHIAAIRRYGLTPLHRRGFVKNFIQL